jgi:hypothetical protein
MPRQIPAPTEVTNLNELFALLTKQFSELQTELVAADRTATGARKAALLELFKDKDIYHSNLTRAASDRTRPS